LEQAGQEYYLDIAFDQGLSVASLRQLIKQDIANKEAARIHNPDIADNIDLSKQQYRFLQKCQNEIYR